MNIVITGGLVLLIPIVLALLAPQRQEDLLPINPAILEEEAVGSVTTAPAPDDRLYLPDRLDRSPVLAWLLALGLLAGLARYVTTTGLGSVGLNEINMLMLALGLILHGSPVAYMNAAAEGARGCAGIIIQFPLYAGIMGMMAASGLVSKMALWFASIASETTLPLFSFVAAGIVNLFIPSGGGQWAVQGPIALESGASLGVPPAKMIMSVAYGDQLTNMLQPFWALPLLAITGVRARDIVGYTAIIMVIAGVWITLGLLVF